MQKSKSLQNFGRVPERTEHEKQIDRIAYCRTHIETRYDFTMCTDIHDMVREIYTQFVKFVGHESYTWYPDFVEHSQELVKKWNVDFHTYFAYLRNLEFIVFRQDMEIYAYEGQSALESKSFFGQIKSINR